MGLTRIVTDTFTEASDVSLTAHTPDLGTSWSAWSGAANVIAANDWALDNNGGDANRFNVAPGAGGDQMDVRGKIRLGGAGVEPIACGVAGRRDGTADSGYEFYWYRATGTYYLETTAGYTSLTEAYPGDWTEFLLQIRTAQKAGIVASVEKVVLTSDVNPTKDVAGILLLNVWAINNVYLDDFSLDLFTETDDAPFGVHAPYPGTQPFNRRR